MARFLRRLRTLLVWASVTVALLCALAAGAVIALREGAFRDALREQLELLGSEVLGVELRIQALEGRLLPDLRLRGVELRSGERILLSAQRLTLRVDLDPLIEGKPIAVRELALTGVRLALWREQDGTWNVAVLLPAEVEAPAEESEAGLALFVDRFVLEDVAVAIDDAGTPRRARLAATLHDIALPFDESAAAALHGSATITPEGQATGVLTLAAGVARLAPYSFELAGGRVALEGELDFADWLDPELDAAGRIRAEVSAVDPAAIPTIDGPAGRLSGRLSADVQRSGGELTSGLLLELDASRIGALEIERALARGSTKRTAWLLDELEIESPSVRARASGRGIAQQIDHLALTLATDDLEPISTLAGIPLSGSLKLDASVGGTLEALRGELSATGRSLSLGGVALGTLELRARSTVPDRVRLERFALRDGELALALTAPAEIELAIADERIAVSRLELRSDPIESLRIDGALQSGALEGVRIRANGIDAAALARLARLELEPAGTASLELALSGPPERPLGTGRLEWRSAELQGIALDRLHAEASAKQGRIDLDIQGFDPGLQEPTVELGADARWASDVPFEGLLERSDTTARLRAREFELERVAHLLPESPQPLTGTLSLELALRGRQPIGQPDVEGWLELHSQPIESLRAEGALRNGTLAGVRVLAAGIDGTAAARLAGLETDPGGRASFELALTGPPVRPLGTGQFEWRTPTLGELALAELRGTLSAENGWIAIDAQGVEANETSPLFQLDARAAWSVDIALERLLERRDTRARLRADELAIGRLAPLLPRPLQSASGVASLDLTFGGSEAGPTAEGRLSLSNGAIQLPFARQRFEPIEVALALREGRVDVEELSAGPPGAQARISGSIDLDGFRLAGSDLAAELQQFQFAQSSLFKAKANGRLTLVGPIDRLELEGDVALDEVRVQLPDERDRELREIQVFAASAGDDATSEFVERSAPPDAYARAIARVSLHVPPGSRVRGRGAELDLEGDLELEKRPLDSIRVTGEASVVRGHIEFQRKRFTLQRGIVNFDGGPDPGDPVVDIIGVHRVRDVSVILRAAGRVSDPPRIDLSGDPPMSSDEALAYLVFGRPVDELREGEKQGVQSAAASLAASVAFDEFGRLLATTGLVDTIDFEIAEGGTIESLRVGAYLGNDTYVRAGNTFVSESEQDVRVEYRLTPWLSVESELSTSGNAGGDLILRLDY
jgi:translocation and assembly module TamB